MVWLTMSRMGKNVPEYLRRYFDRAKNRYCPPARYVYLSGWIGEDMRKVWIDSEDLPHTTEAMMKQNFNEKPRVREKKYHKFLMDELREPIFDWKIFPGDTVEILVGRNKGTQGIVSRVVHERNWVFVEGLNLEQKYLHGGRVYTASEMPLDVSTEVQLVDPLTMAPAESVEWRYTAEGTRVRVSFPSERLIPLPQPESSSYADNVNPPSYETQSSTDTSPVVLKKATYKPTLKTFMEEISEKMDIKDDRKRGKTYWY